MCLIFQVFILTILNSWSPHYMCMLLYTRGPQGNGEHQALVTSSLKAFRGLGNIGSSGREMESGTCPPLVEGLEQETLWTH